MRKISTVRCPPVVRTAAHVAVFIPTVAFSVAAEVPLYGHGLAIVTINVVVRNVPFFSFIHVVAARQCRRKVAAPRMCIGKYSPALDLITHMGMTANTDVGFLR